MNVAVGIFNNQLDGPAIAGRFMRSTAAQRGLIRPDLANEPPTDDQEGLTASWRSGL